MAHPWRKSRTGGAAWERAEPLYAQRHWRGEAMLGQLGDGAWVVEKGRRTVAATWSGTTGEFAQRKRRSLRPRQPLEGTHAGSSASRKVSAGQGFTAGVTLSH